MDLNRTASLSVITLFGAATLTVLAFVPATAQQTTGTPGLPSATTTIDGRYLPAPPQRFQGDIGLNAMQSKPAWPARVVPPKDAPNILLIMTDDVGFGAPSTFGGVLMLTSLTLTMRAMRPTLSKKAATWW